MFSLMALAILMAPAHARQIWTPSAAQKKIVRLSETRTFALLIRMVKKSGQKCDGPLNHQMLGLYEGDGTLWYILNCGNDDFIIYIPRRERAITKVISCSELRKTHKISCSPLRPEYFINPL